MACTSSTSWSKPVAFRKGVLSITIEYLMWASAPLGSLGRPKRPRLWLKTNSGRGTRIRPVSRASTLRGTGWGPATLYTPRGRRSTVAQMALTTSHSCMY